MFLYASDLDGSKLRLVVREHAAMLPLDLVTLAPDGSQVAYVRASDQRSFTDAGIRVMNTLTGKVVSEIEAKNGYFNVSPLWSPDGRSLAFVRGYLDHTREVKAELWLASPTSRKPIPLVADNSFGPAFFYGKSHSIAWTPGGDAIQYYDEIGSQEVFQVSTDLGSNTITAALSVVPSIADYVARIQTARASATSTMIKPISGLPDYYGRNSNYYNVLYLQKYYDPGEFEGSGTHPGVDIHNVSCSSTVIRSVANGTVWREVHTWGPSGSNPCGDNRGYGASPGNHVILRHEIDSDFGGYQGTVYAIYEHLFSVSKGACSTCSLFMGSQIGTAGSTGYSSGPHLHFQIDREGAQFHPYWPANCCSDTSQIPTVIANTVNPMMFVQAHESLAGVTVYDGAGLCPPYTCCLGETFRVSDPYLRENPIGESTISSASIPAGWVLLVYPERHYQGTPQEFYSDVTDFAAYGLDNSIRSLKVAYMACPAGTLAENEVPRAGVESCLPGANQPTSTPTPYVPPGTMDGLRLVSVSAPTVLKGQSFGVNVTYEIVSGSLLESRGDHLHATPEDSSNTFGAWPVQGVSGSHYAGALVTFSFNLAAPQSTGTFESHWRLRVGGNHIGPEAVIRFTVQDEPPAPPGGVIICTGTGYTDCYGPLTQDYASVDPINDQIESVWINGCYSAVLYWDSNFSGEHMHTGGASDLGDRWRNQTSSIRVRSCDNAAFTLYGLGDYNGESWASDRTLLDLGHWEKNDWAQSIRVSSGKGIVACEHADFHGRCGRVTGPAQFGDINALAQGLRNGLSSVRVCDGACPQPPGAPSILSPATGGHTPSNKEVILRWAGDGWQYYAELWGGGISGTRQFGWSATGQWNAGLLPASTNPYYWRVRGWNGYGEGDWADGTFFVQAPTVEVMGVYTTDENGATSQGAGVPREQTSQTELSAFKTAFNAGDQIRLYIDTNNDFTVATEASFEWRVTDPAGRVDESLSLSATGSTSPGRVGWYLPGTIPSDALSGEYTFTGLITYGGQTTSKSTAFQVTGAPIVQAVGAFTTDELGPASEAEGPARVDPAGAEGSAYKSSFVAGDPIRLCIDVYSNIDRDVLAGFEWSAADMFNREVQALSWSGELTASPGRTWWCLSSSIPTDALTSDYVFRGAINYLGILTTYEATFHVSGPPRLELIKAFTADGDGPGTAGESAPQNQRAEGPDVAAYKTDFNAGEQIELGLATYNDLAGAQDAEYEWLVLNPLGQTVPYMTWRGTLPAGTGLDYWSLDGTIWQYAYTGEYLFSGTVIHDGRTTQSATTFHVTGQPRVDILDVFATDDGGVSGSSVAPRATGREVAASEVTSQFAAGDPIRLYIETYNNVTSDVAAEFAWSVTDPFGQPVPELSTSGTLTTPAQGIWWFLPTTVPQSAASGEYAFQGSVVYGGRTSSRSTSLCVAGAAPPPYTASSEVATGDPPAFAIPYTRAAFDFSQSTSGSVSVTLHSGVAPDAPDGVTMVPGYWDMAADFAGFTTDVILGYSSCDLGGIDEAAITGAACWNPDRAGWAYIAGAVDTEANTVTLAGRQTLSRCFLIATAAPEAPTGLTIAQDGETARLSWQPVTEDIRGTGIASPHYLVYRSSDGPAFAPAGDTLIATVTDTTWADADAVSDTGHDYFYVVRATDAEQRTSAISNRAGKLVRAILPGWNLVAWPVLVADGALDAAVGDQLHGTGSPETADRVLVWNGATQSYDSAWFCGGPLCESWAGRWLSNNSEPSPLVLPANAGFWIQNRSGDQEVLTVLGGIPEAARDVPVGMGWQLLGSAFPTALPLDDARLPAAGADSPETADRVLVWNEAAQSYDSAWFCGGPICEAWGESWANRWLDNGYAPTDIVLRPGEGFWFQNRHSPATWINGR